MQTHELKEAIATTALEIKQQKKMIRQMQQEGDPRAADVMSNLTVTRWRVRIMYLVYAWFRGKRASQVEHNPPERYQITFMLKKILEDEAKRKLFFEWLESTRTNSTAAQEVVGL